MCHGLQCAANGFFMGFSYLATPTAPRSDLVASEVFGAAGMLDRKFNKFSSPSCFCRPRRDLEWQRQRPVGWNQRRIRRRPSCIRKRTSLNGLRVRLVNHGCILTFRNVSPTDPLAHASTTFRRQVFAKELSGYIFRFRFAKFPSQKLQALHLSRRCTSFPGFLCQQVSEFGRRGRYPENPLLARPATNASPEGTIKPLRRCSQIMSTATNFGTRFGAGFTPCENKIEGVSEVVEALYRFVALCTQGTEDQRQLLDIAWMNS